MSRVVHFNITAVEPLRAAKFYSDVFGWKIEKRAGGPTGPDAFAIRTGDAKAPGIDGFLIQRQAAHERVIQYIGVKSLDEFLPRVVENGGEIVKERTAVPGFGYTAVCLDPEDNLFGIIEADATVK